MIVDRPESAGRGIVAGPYPGAETEAEPPANDTRSDCQTVTRYTASTSAVTVVMEELAAVLSRTRPSGPVTPRVGATRPGRNGCRTTTSAPAIGSPPG